MRRQVDHLPNQFLINMNKIQSDDPRYRSFKRDPISVKKASKQLIKVFIANTTVVIWFLDHILQVILYLSITLELYL